MTHTVVFKEFTVWLGRWTSYQVIMVLRCMLGWDSVGAVGTQASPDKGLREGDI